MTVLVLISLTFYYLFSHLYSRTHVQGLQTPCYHLSKIKFLLIRTVDVWNSIPECLVAAQSLNEFKNQLDDFFIIDFWSIVLTHLKLFLYLIRTYRLLPLSFKLIIKFVPLSIWYMSIGTAAKYTPLYIRREGYFPLYIRKFLVVNIN